MNVVMLADGGPGHRRAQLLYPQPAGPDVRLRRKWHPRTPYRPTLHSRQLRIAFPATLRGTNARQRNLLEARLNSSSSMRKGPFLLGVFLLTFSLLTFQIIQTRILSVIAWYYMAFFAISVAMLGMTVGAVWVYLHRERIRIRLAIRYPDQLRARNGTGYACIGHGAVLPRHHSFAFAHHRRFVESASDLHGHPLCLLRGCGQSGADPQPIPHGTGLRCRSSGRCTRLHGSHPAPESSGWPDRCHCFRRRMWSIRYSIRLERLLRRSTTVRIKNPGGVVQSPSQSHWWCSQYSIHWRLSACVPYWSKTALRPMPWAYTKSGTPILESSPAPQRCAFLKCGAHLPPCRGICTLCRRN